MVHDRHFIILSSYHYPCLYIYHLFFVKGQYLSSISFSITCSTFDLKNSTIAWPSTSDVCASKPDFSPWMLRPQANAAACNLGKEVMWCNQASTLGRKFESPDWSKDKASWNKIKSHQLQDFGGRIVWLHPTRSKATYSITLYIVLFKGRKYVGWWLLPLTLEHRITSSMLNRNWLENSHCTPRSDVYLILSGKVICGGRREFPPSAYYILEISGLFYLFWTNSLLPP